MALKPSHCFNNFFKVVLKVILLTLFVIDTHASSPKLLVLGDSISAGYGINLDNGWVALLQQRINDKGLSVEVVNGSISGNTSADGLARLPKLLDVHQPHYIIVELGGNDGLRGYPLKLLRKNLLKIIELSHQSNVKVLLAGMEIPPNYGERYTKLFRQTYAKVAETAQVKLVPFILADVATVTELMQEDGIHPTEEAQPQLLETIWGQLKVMLLEEVEAKSTNG